jgi:hypothetical protein
MRYLPPVVKTHPFFSGIYGVARVENHPYVLIYAVFAGIWGEGGGIDLQDRSGRVQSVWDEVTGRSILRFR